MPDIQRSLSTKDLGPFLDTDCVGLGDLLQRSEDEFSLSFPGYLCYRRFGAATEKSEDAPASRPVIVRDISDKILLGL